MHYNGRGFKSDEGRIEDKRPPILKPGADELLQFRAHFGWDLHLVAAGLARDVDGLAVGAQEFDTRRTIAKMVVEPAFYVRVNGLLHVVEQQPIDIATAKCKPKKLRWSIHFFMFDAAISRNDSPEAKNLRRVYSGSVMTKGLRSRVLFTGLTAVLSCVVMAGDTTARKPNRLIHETSPYLLQHAYNPVQLY